MSKLMGWLAVWLALSYQVIGQHLLLQGKVVDKTTGEPLPFASIGNKRNTIGTASNSQGAFSIKIPQAALEDTLTFSFIGYAPARIPIGILQDKPAVVGLAAISVPLQEVVVRAAFSARDTLEKAIRLIPENYSEVPLLLEGFYRETLRENKSKVHRLYAEGVLECYKPSCANLADPDEVRVVKGRKKKLPYGGLPQIINGPRVGVILDVVKSKEFFLHPSRFNSYLYRFEKVVALNGKPAYVIAFEPRNNFSAKAYFAGKIYLQSSDLAFVGADYEIAPPGLVTVNQTGLPLQISSRRYSVSYTHYQGRWCLQNGSIVNHFVHSKTGDTLTSNIIFTITARSSENVTRFKRRELISDEQTFAEEVKAFEDSYWQNYNIIQEESEEKSNQP